MRDYREATRTMSVPASDEDKKVEMMAMFLCDSGIVSLGPSDDGGRRSGGHGWHRTHSDEADKYRAQARLAIGALTTRRIP